MLLFHAFTVIKILLCVRSILLIQPIPCILLLKPLSAYTIYYICHYLAGESSDMVCMWNGPHISYPQQVCHLQAAHLTSFDQLTDMRYGLDHLLLPSENGNSCARDIISI